MSLQHLPHPAVVNTGEQHTLQPTIDAFFSATKETIEARLGKQEGPYFEIKSREMANEQGVITDDRITYLLYKDRMVCGVFERRTQWNHVEYTFFRDLRCLDDLTRR